MVYELTYTSFVTKKYYINLNIKYKRQFSIHN